MNWQRHNSNFLLIVGKDHVATVFRRGDQWSYAITHEAQPCPLNFETSDEAKHYAIAKLQRCYG